METGEIKNEAFLLHLIDVVFNTYTESSEVPDIEWAQQMIEQAKETFPNKEGEAVIVPKPRPLIEFEGEANWADDTNVEINSPDMGVTLTDRSQMYLISPDLGKKYRVTITEVK